MGLAYVFLTIIFTVYGQLVIKWQVMQAGQLPVNFSGKVIFLLNLLINPWVISAFAAAFLAALSWMVAMTKLELTYAYPFMSLSFVLVLIFGAILFQELLTWQKIVGVAFIILGVIVIGHG